MNHNKEVSCVGFLFYDVTSPLFIQLVEATTCKIGLLLQVFRDELDTNDNIKGEMLQMLLVRLPITRLARQQHLRGPPEDEWTFTLFREFDFLVENNYRELHTTQFYWDTLHKLPKTLANVFALYEKQSPLQIVQSRIVLEAKRLFYYSDKSSKEIAAELGFEDASHFGRFF